MLTALPFDSLLDLLLDLLRSCAVRLPLHLLICRYDFLFFTTIRHRRTSHGRLDK
jgi:hypothetical protein